MSFKKIKDKKDGKQYINKFIFVFVLAFIYLSSMIVYILYMSLVSVTYSLHSQWTHNNTWLSGSRYQYPQSWTHTHMHICSNENTHIQPHNHQLITTIQTKIMCVVTEAMSIHPLLW